MSKKTLSLTILLVFALAMPALPFVSTHAQGTPSGKIVVWGWKSAMTDTLVASGVLDDFKAAYPNVEVEIQEYAPQDVYVNFPLALTAGEKVPDVAILRAVTSRKSSRWVVCST